MRFARSSASSAPEPRDEPANLGARLRLRRARSSACGNCRRVTKTVDGVCAECWAVKEERALLARPRHRDDDVLFDWDNPLDVVLAVAGIGAAAAVALRLLGWI